MGGNEPHIGPRSHTHKKGMNGDRERRNKDKIVGTTQSDIKQPGTERGREGGGTGTIRRGGVNTLRRLT